MLADITSSFYEYVRGGLVILSIYHVLIFFQNKRKLYLYYSLYFLTVFVFFFSQIHHSKSVARFFVHIIPSVHGMAYVFYLSFTRKLLDTENTIPKWDKYLKLARKIILFGIVPFLTISAVLGGYTIQMYMFFVFGTLVSLFSIATYFKFYSIGTTIAKYCVFGSLLYFVFANITFVFNMFFTIDEFIAITGIHLTFFTYVAAILDAIVFALLIGYKIRVLEEEKKESLKEIETLKRIVIKDYIVLKDKSKVYIKDLIYIKSEDHYLSVFLEDNKNHFVRGKLSTIINELPPNFEKCHRSYIVNKNAIKQVSGNLITLKNKIQIPLSRTYKDTFKSM